IDLLRKIGIEKGGVIKEDCELISIHKNGNGFVALVRDHDKSYVEYHADNFVNALGPTGEKFTRQLGIYTGIYPVKHQAFITRRLPWLGVNGDPLGMLIDRRNYKGFVAVYGQQLAETGQIIGCASPAVDPREADKNLKYNSQDFIEIASEVFSGWIPQLSSVGFQAVWAGYYVEPRMFIDTKHGLFTGLRGQGFMLSMGLAKMYVDELTGKLVPEYFKRLRLEGDGLPEKAFK
ncbi:MAG TPA: FAD-binding oxidoreductase, partial [Tenuifilaceae bacterium]|nr:FAD-binding oxidoreductase [Tenuifilaceae bacterium]